MLSKYCDRWYVEDNMTFENFISIETNQSAKATAIAFAKGESDFNILSITSSTGNGATHLASAILKEIEKNSGSREVLSIGYQRLLHQFMKEEMQEILTPTFFNEKAAILIDSVWGIQGMEIGGARYRLFEFLQNAKTKVILTHDFEVHLPITEKEIHVEIPSPNEKSIIITNYLESLTHKSFLNLPGDIRYDMPPKVISDIANCPGLCVREVLGMVISIYFFECTGQSSRWKIEGGTLVIM